jgi:hypothetical protein
MKKLLSITFSFGLLTSFIAGAAVSAQEEALAQETVTGVIEAVDTEANTIAIDGAILTVTDAAVVDTEGKACSLGDLKEGMEVTATYNPDMMEAVEIHATPAMEEAPAEETPAPFEIPTW